MCNAAKFNDGSKPVQMQMTQKTNIMTNYVLAQQNFLLQCFAGTGEYITGFDVQKDGAVIAYLSDGGFTSMWTFCEYINRNFCVDTYLSDF